MQNMCLADLERVRELGAGAMGQVTLVRHGSQSYALKSLSKAHLVQTGLQVTWSCCSPAQLLSQPALAAKCLNLGGCPICWRHEISQARTDFCLDAFSHLLQKPYD